MKNQSPSFSSAPSTRAGRRDPHLRLLALGMASGLVAYAALPWVIRQWKETSDQAERLCTRVQPPFVPLPTDTPVRELAGLNAR